jgi:hypothetical protein
VLTVRCVRIGATAETRAETTAIIRPNLSMMIWKG